MIKLNIERTLYSLIILFSAFLIHSPSLSSQEDISVYRERLAKIQQEKMNIQKKIDDLDRRKTSTLSQLDRIGLEKKLIQEELAEYNLQMRRANNELSSIQRQIPILKEKVEKEKDAVAKILVTLYKFATSAIWTFCFAPKISPISCRRTGI